MRRYLTLNNALLRRTKRHIALTEDCCRPAGLPEYTSPPTNTPNFLPFHLYTSYLAAQSLAFLSFFFFFFSSLPASTSPPSPSSPFFSPTGSISIDSPALMLVLKPVALSAAAPAAGSETIDVAVSAGPGAAAVLLLLLIVVDEEGTEAGPAAGAGEEEATRASSALRASALGISYIRWSNQYPCESTPRGLLNWQAQPINRRIIYSIGDNNAMLIVTHLLLSASALAPPDPTAPAPLPLGPGNLSHPSSCHPLTIPTFVASSNTFPPTSLITGLIGAGNQYWNANVSERSPLDSPSSDNLKKRR